MRPRFVLLCLAAALAITSCATPQQRREAVTRRIVDDAMAFNEAYHGAITAQVLLNIMRAANRQPRQYTSMSGFTQTGGTRSASITVGGVQLDQIGDSWGDGEFSTSTSRPLAPDYIVSPFESEAFANLVVRPTNPLLFRYYWDTGWNPDLLLMLLVDRVRVLPVGGGAGRDLRNSAGTIANDCTGGNDDGGCAFVIAMRQLAVDLTRAERIAPPARAAGECALFAAYITADGDAAAQRRAIAATRGGATTDAATCPIEIAVGGQRYVMALRSLDDVIYYVGHLVRRDAAHPAPAGEMQARLGVTSPGFPIWADERTPLFRIVEANDETEREYAATVTFGGRRYSAGAPLDRFCYDEDNLDACRTGEYLDGSGAVLELLVGILAFNQSDAAITAPQNSVLDVR
jgi:hypothetical protein